MVKRKLMPFPKAEQPIVLVINRFETLCGECNKNIDSMAKVCKFCGAKFTHSTTTCPLTWMVSNVQNLRKDLAFISKEELVNLGKIYL